MLEHLRTHLGRHTVFLVGGIAIGAFLAPAFGGGGAQAVTTYSRAVSCSGFGFLPTDDFHHYTSMGTRRTGADGWFACEADLPHKAVVTRVRFTLLDEYIGGGVDDCALVRVRLTAGPWTPEQVMAVVPDTSTSLGGPTVDIQRLADTTINYATIDNTNFAYYLQCYVASGPAPGAVGIYGADITFKVTAANG